MVKALDKGRFSRRRFSKRRLRSIGWFLITTLCCGFTQAQTSTNINLNLVFGNGSDYVAHTFILGQTGSVGPLGNAALVLTSSLASNNNGTIVGPWQATFELAFNEADTIAISFSESDPNVLAPTISNLSGGTITGGTGAYAGATGSLDLTITKDSAGALWSTSTTTGSGQVTVGSNTTPLTLTGFRGWCCGWSTREQDYFDSPMTVTGSLGKANATIIGYYYFTPSPGQVNGTITISFNSADTLTLGFAYPITPGSSIAPPPAFNGNAAGGTGKYANAAGALAYTTTSNGYSVTGTITTAPGAVITNVKTIYGSSVVAYNTWLEVHGHNLVPADTPSSGVDWSNAPDFANGQMPTQLGPVSVSFGGAATPGYIYWYCSAQTNPNCADDQINVLAPLLGLNYPGPLKIAVNSNGVPIADAPVFREPESPAFLSFDTKGHIAARHADASLMGPASLYPGYTTPAKAGEIVSLYGTGFGPAGGGSIVAGSATQSGNLNTPGLSCWISGLNAQAVGALVSPGLYQINLTVPKAAPSGDNPVVCIYNFYPTSPGALVAVQ